MTLLLDFVGTHSTGKTTLMTEAYSMLTKRGFTTTIVPSVSRTLLTSRRLLLYDKTSEVTQAYISLTNWARILKAVEDFDFVLCTDLGVRSLAYSMTAKCGSEFLEDTKTFISHFISYFCECNIAVTRLYFPIEFPLVEDSVRKVDETYRKLVDDNIVRIMSDFNLSAVTIDGNRNARTKKLSQLLDPLTLSLEGEAL